MSVSYKPYSRMVKVCQETVLVVFITSIIWLAIDARELFEMPVPSENRTLSNTSFSCSSNTSCSLEQYDIGNATTSRIVGGREAPVGAFPWMVALMYNHQSSDRIECGCGGSLINNRHVITAAHCTEIDGLVLSFVRLGIHHLYILGDNGMDVEIDRFVVHPNYDGRLYTHDIALVKLVMAIGFTDYIYPILLPEEPRFNQEDLRERTAVLAGWGGLRFGVVTISMRLQMVALVIHDTRDCLIQNAPEILHDCKYIICAGDEKMGAWKADSGGPLMIQEVEGDINRNYLIGIISSGRPFRPTLCARVSMYIDWIRNVLRRT